MFTSPGASLCRLSRMDRSRTWREASLQFNVKFGLCREKATGVHCDSYVKGLPEGGVDQIEQLCLSAASCSKGALTGYMREQWPSRYELGGGRAFFASQIVHLIQAQALATGQQCKTRFGSLGVLRLSRGALSRKVVTSTTTSNASVGAPTGAGDPVGSPVGASVRSGNHGSDNHRPSGGEPPGGGRLWRPWR